MNKQRIGLAIAAVLLAGCAAAPAPTPQVIVKTVEVPGPQPTPQVVTKTVEVKVPTPITPQACIDALDAGDKVISDFSDWLAAMSDEDYAKAEKITERTGESLRTYYSHSAECRGEATGMGS